MLTHLDKSMDYAALSAEVPASIVVGYDWDGTGRFTGDSLVSLIVR